MIVVALALAGRVQAASITLQSINSGTYQYGLTLAPGDTVVFNQNSQIDLTGLASVTGTSPTNFGFTSCGFTDTSVCFAEVFGTQTFDNPSASPTEFDLFTITSTANAVGLVSYTAQATVPFSGQVDGPASAPEPGTVLLTAGGLLGLLFSARRLLKRT